MTTAEATLQAATRAAPSACVAYLRGRHINLSTRRLLDAAQARLGLPAPPAHAPCSQCLAAAREDGRLARDLRYRHGVG